MTNKKARPDSWSGLCFNTISYSNRREAFSFQYSGGTACCFFWMRLDNVRIASLAFAYDLLTGNKKPFQMHRLEGS